MKMADFIAATLSEIVDGSSKAQEYAITKGAVVNPPNIVLIHGTSKGTREEYKTVNVEFDIMITIDATEEKKGGIGVFPGILGVGVQGNVGHSSGESNRVKFSVPIQLPQPQ